MEHQLAVGGHPAATPHFTGDGVRARDDDDFPTTTGMKQQTEPKMFEGASGSPSISVAVRALPPHALLTPGDHFNCGGQVGAGPWALPRSALLPAARHIVAARMTARHARCRYPTTMATHARR